MASNNKRIGILTFHRESNYGAFLQTFALFEMLKKMGCDVEIIDFRLPIISQGFIRNIFRYFLIDRRDFAKARTKFLKLTTERYFNSNELVAKLPNFDLFIVGSDQVWTEEITKEVRDTYFFDFLPDDVKRISYAASFGTDNWIYNDLDSLRISKLLTKFSGISVREKSAVTYCANKLNMHAQLVLDPTLLLDDYSKITGEYTGKNDHLVFFKFVRDSNYYDFVLKMGEIYGGKSVLLKDAKSLKTTKTIYFPTIKEWLCSIKGAGFVVTDSFHGLCFSIIFRKQFLVIPGCLDRFVRLHDLLSTLGLESRIFYSYDEVLSSNRWKEMIDYDLVYKKLNQERITAIEFLQKHLQPNEED